MRWTSDIADSDGDSDTQSDCFLQLWVFAMADGDEAEVTLHLYDLTQGMARQMSQQLLGIHLEGVWHSGVCFRGREYYFGGGIFHEPAGATPYGRPDKRLVLGRTRRTRVEFEEFLNRVRPRFRMQDYDLLRHNCNNFTNECSVFLVGSGIPVDIIDLPNRALSTPLGQMLRPQIEAYRESMVQRFAGVDARITAEAAGLQGEGGAHAAVHVPLFTSGNPIAFETGSLDKAVERLGQLLREHGFSLLATDNIIQLALVTNAANFPASFPEARLAPLVNDAIKAMQALPSAAHYPIFDILRVVCLHPRGTQVLLAHADRDALFKFLFEAQSSKLSFVAALRLVQNLLLAAESPLAIPPRDAATARLLVAGIQSPELQVRKGAAFAAYNFALAMQQKGEDEAGVIFVSGVGHYLRAPADALDSYEFLSVLLSLGSICYGRVHLVSLFRSLKLDLRPFRNGASEQLRMTLDQLEMLLNA